ncbi:unnamed protein product, partial [Discosporangium mesarthrocarpum]
MLQHHAFSLQQEEQLRYQRRVALDDLQQGERERREREQQAMVQQHIHQLQLLQQHQQHQQHQAHQFGGGGGAPGLGQSQKLPVGAGGQAGVQPPLQQQQHPHELRHFQHQLSQHSHQVGQPQPPPQYNFLAPPPAPDRGQMSMGGGSVGGSVGTEISRGGTPSGSGAGASISASRVGARRAQDRMSSPPFPPPSVPQPSSSRLGYPQGGRLGESDTSAVAAAATAAAAMAVVSAGGDGRMDVRGGHSDATSPYLGHLFHSPYQLGAPPSYMSAGAAEGGVGGMAGGAMPSGTMPGGNMPGVVQPAEAALSLGGDGVAGSAVAGAQSYTPQVGDMKHSIGAGGQGGNRFFMMPNDGRGDPSQFYPLGAGAGAGP